MNVYFGNFIKTYEQSDLWIGKLNLILCRIIAEVAGIWPMARPPTACVPPSGSYCRFWKKGRKLYSSQLSTNKLIKEVFFSIILSVSIWLLLWQSQVIVLFCSLFTLMIMETRMPDIHIWTFWLLNKLLYTREVIQLLLFSP